MKKLTAASEVGAQVRAYFAALPPATRKNFKKEHTSIYPLGPATAKKYGIDLKDYQVSKGTIRFPLTRPPSAALVKRLVQARVAEIRKNG